MRMRMSILCLFLSGLVLTAESRGQENSSTSWPALARDLIYAPKNTLFVFALNPQHFQEGPIAGLLTEQEKRVIGEDFSGHLGIPYQDMASYTTFATGEGSFTVIRTTTPLKADEILNRKLAAEKKWYSSSVFNFVQPRLGEEPAPKKSIEEQLREKWKQVQIGNHQFYERHEVLFDDYARHKAFCVIEPQVCLMWEMSSSNVNQSALRHYLQNPGAAPALSTGLQSALKTASGKAPILYAYCMDGDASAVAKSLASAPTALKHLAVGPQWVAGEVDYTADDMLKIRIFLSCRDGVDPGDLRKTVEAGLTAISQQDVPQASEQALQSAFSRVWLKRLQKSMSWAKQDNIVRVDFEIDPIQLVVPIMALGTRANATFTQVGNEIGNAPPEVPKFAPVEVVPQK